MDELLESLKEIRQILSQSFDTSYGTEPTNTTYTNKHEKYHDSYRHDFDSKNEYTSYRRDLEYADALCRTAYYIPSMPIYPTSTTVINNNYSTKDDTKKEKNKETKVATTSTGTMLLGGVAIAVISGTTTYLMSNDEYIIFYTSELTEKINIIRDHLKYSYKLSNTDINTYNLETILKNYDTWLALFQKRTKNVCVSKIAGGSALTIGMAGIIIGSNFVLGGGIIGGTASGCYLLWKYLKNNTRKETQSYMALINEIDKLIKILEDTKQQQNNPNPSAPPPPSAEPPAYEDISKDAK